MKNVAITGISGYVGTRLLTALEGADGVHNIIGIDTEEPRLKPAKLKFYRRDIREPSGDLFVANKVDTAIHLAFILRPTRKAALARQIDIEGMTNLVDACQQANVKHILYLSSHTVYGAHRDNPMPLTEDSPLRPLPGFQYSQDKVIAERILRDFGASDHNVTTTILRICPVIGPNAAGSATTIMFTPLVMFGAAGSDPPMQFVHEDDLTRLIKVIITRGRGGTFNVAGDGVLKYSAVAKMLRKRLLKLPGRLLELAVSLSWLTHLQSASPASGTRFIEYPPVVSTDKLARELGFKFQYSAEEALASFADVVKR
jgi:UDP-glucose 4-epimerase